MTTVEPEWDTRAADEMVALSEVESRTCHGCSTDLGLSTDPDLAAKGVDVNDESICWVCRGKEAHERRLRDLHEKDPAWWDGRAVFASLVSTQSTEGGD